MKSHVHPAIKSIHYAIEGITEAFREEPNLRIHVIFATLAIILAFIFKLNSNQWLALIISITLVLVLELLNTALEELTDLASPSIHPKAKLAKDVAAGAVLISALNSIIVGLIIFVPHFLSLL